MISNLYWIKSPNKILEKQDEEILFNPDNLACVRIKSAKKVKSILKKYYKKRILNKKEMTIINKLVDCGVIIDIKPSISNSATNFFNEINRKPNGKNFYNNSCDKADQFFTIYLLVSQICNLSCVYCYAGEGNYGDKSLMSESTADNIIANMLFFMKKNQRRKVRILFFGGEPLLNFSLIKLIVKKLDQIAILNSYEFIYALTTNFTNVSEEILEFIHVNIKELLISLDGFTIEQNSARLYNNGCDSTAAVLKNLERVDQLGIRYGIRVTVHAKNLKDLPEIVNYFIAKENITELDLIPVSPWDCNGNIISKELMPDITKYILQLQKIFKNSLNNLYKIAPFSVFLKQIEFGKRKVTCGALAGNTIAVTTDGSIYPCSNMVGINKLRLGHINEPIENAVEKVNFTLKKEIEFIIHTKKCDKCIYLSLCYGQCALNPLMSEFDFYIPTYAMQYWSNILCAQAKTSIELGLWALSEGIKGWNNKTIL